MGTSSGAYELNRECAPERVPIIYFRDKSRVQMFYFDSTTTVPFQCVSLVFVSKAYVDRLSFG